MPYCPKCDMEFVDGITTCSDCGGPLVESLEAAEAMKREQQAREREKQEREQAEWMAEAVRLSEKESESDETEESDSPVRPDESMKKAAEARAQARVYMSKRQRVEDMRSSISAFTIVGGLFLVFGILTLTDIVHLPLAAGAGLLFKIVLTAIGAACLVLAVTTRSSAAKLEKEADVEDKQTEELIQWFASTYTAKELDGQLLAEDPSLSGNELELKRFELIQDRLITHADLPDPAYVDSLCEEIYGKVYE